FCYHLYTIINYICHIVALNKHILVFFGYKRQTNISHNVVVFNLAILANSLDKMTLKKYDFTGKVALITGSSSGIGAAVAIQFAQCGAKVVITGHVAADVDQMVAQIEKISNEKPLSLVGSLVDDAFAEKLVQETVARYNRIDVLVNNAGR